jgi:formate dehydrogenase subunit gamma
MLLALRWPWRWAWLAWRHGRSAGTPAADAPGGPAGGLYRAGRAQADENQRRRAPKTQPGNNAPMWRAVRESGTQPGYSSLPGAEKGVLIQPFVQYPGSSFTTAGEAWRQVRNNWIIPYGGSLLLIIACWPWRMTSTSPRARWAATRTPAARSSASRPSSAPRTGPTPIAFVVLAVSGIVMAFGKFFLLPVIGARCSAG